MPLLGRKTKGYRNLWARRCRRRSEPFQIFRRYIRIHGAVRLDPCVIKNTGGLAIFTVSFFNHTFKGFSHDGVREFPRGQLTLVDYEGVADEITRRFFLLRNTFGARLLFNNPPSKMIQFHQPG